MQINFTVVDIRVPALSLCVYDASGDPKVPQVTGGPVVDQIVALAKEAKPLALHQVREAVDFFTNELGPRGPVYAPIFGPVRRRSQITWPIIKIQSGNISIT